MAEEREEKIRARAHRLWEQEGSPEGREADHWHQAEQEIDAEAPILPDSKQPIADMEA